MANMTKRISAGSCRVPNTFFEVLPLLLPMSVAVPVPAGNRGAVVVAAAIDPGALPDP